MHGPPLWRLISGTNCIARFGLAGTPVLHRRPCACDLGLDIARKNGGTQRITLLRHGQFELLGSSLCRLRTFRFYQHVAMSQNAVQSVVGTQEKRGFVGIALPLAAAQMRMIEQD